jgi:hypothetical protein
MEQARTFSLIVFLLHMSEPEVTRFVQQLGIRPSSVPRRKTAWGHVAKSDEKQRLTFGRRGLKRVKAGKLINRLSELGYRYCDCAIGQKPDTYTKTDVRAAKHAGRDPLKAGDPKFDEDGYRSWQFCLAITFELDPSLPLGPEADLLTSILEPLVWRRARAFSRLDGETRSSIVELVEPKQNNPRSFTELSFEPPDLFTARTVSPP